MSSSRQVHQPSALEQIETEIEALRLWIQKKCKESKAFRYVMGAIKGGAPAVGSVLGGAALIGLSLSGVGVILIAVGAFIGATIWKSRKILKEIKALEDSAEKEKLLKEVLTLNATITQQGREIRILNDRYERLVTDNPNLNPHSIDNMLGGKKVSLGSIIKDAPPWAAYKAPNDDVDDENGILLTTRPTSVPHSQLHGALLKTQSGNNAPSKKDPLSESTEAIRTALQVELDAKMAELTNEEKRKQSLAKQAPSKTSPAKAYSTFKDDDEEEADPLVAAVAAMGAAAASKHSTHKTSDAPKNEKTALLRR